MKKIGILAIALLAFLTITMLPTLNVGNSLPTPIELTRDVTPYMEQEADASALATYIDSQGWWIDMVDADLVGNDGAGIYVAVLDTGLLSNYLTFFPPSMVDIKEEWGAGFSYDFTWNPVIGDYDEAWNPNRGFLTNTYGSGHGTHVTSIVTGFAAGSRWYRGVAPKVTIIPVLVLDTWFLNCPDPTYPGYHNGKVLWTGGSYEMIAAGITYIADLAEREGIKIIINMSLGGRLPGAVEEAAINYAISKGVIIVASAGNNGEAGMGWPGAFPQVISAAACGWTMYSTAAGANVRGDVPEKLNTQDVYGNNWQVFLEDFSARPNPDYTYGGYYIPQDKKDLDVCTPGQAIVGPHKPYIYWSGTAWVNPGIAYYYVWGTSQAAPHVSGIAALVAQSYPAFNQFDMEWVLKKAAGQVPLPSDGAECYDFYPVWYEFFWNDHDYGTGLLQAPAALKWAKIQGQRLPE